MPEAGFGSAMPDLAPGSEFAGYRIERLLDRGGMGLVYEARDPLLGRNVALKIIAPEYTRDATAAARFKSEARLAASLEHPNIVPIHRGGEHEGVLYLVMRFVPGSNLREVIKIGPLDLPRAARVVDAVGSALDAAHQSGLVHRDVKPANILVTGQGEKEHIYLTDFGVTKQLGEGGGGLTRTGGWVGTADYVAPEQVQGKPIDGRADVYSLGCVVYEMLTGKVPYPRPSEPAKLWAHVTDPPALPSKERPELDPVWDDVVARATAKNPDDRYPTAGELAQAVRAAVAHQEAERTRDAAPETRLAGAGADPEAEQATRLGAADSAAGTGMPASTGAPPPTGAPAPAGGPAVAAGTGAAVGSGAAAGGTAPPPTGTQGHGGDGSAPRRRRAVAGVVLGACAIIVAVVVLAGALGGGGNDAAGGQGDVERQTGLSPVPTNKVDGSGNVTLTLDGNAADVKVDASGLPDGEHLMHIHADGRDRCPSAAAARVHNGHRAITGKDGIPDYGRPLVSLTTSGDTTLESAFASSARYKEGTSFDYERNIDVGQSMAARIRQGEGVIVVHGIDWDRDGKYGAVLQGATIPKDELSGELTAPALCGPLVPKEQASTGSGGDGKQVFVANFRPAEEPTGPTQPGAADPKLFCPLPKGTAGSSQPLS